MAIDSGSKFRFSLSHSTRHFVILRGSSFRIACLRPWILLLSVLLLFGPLCPAGWAALSPGDHALTFESTCDGSQQPYRLFIPKAAESKHPLPLLVVLHGKGVNQNAWFDYTPVKEVAELRGYVVVAPLGRGDWFYRGPAEQDVLDVIDKTEHDLPIDPDRVYLMGHSMGGWGTWWIGLRHPDLFVTICPMSGMAPADLLPNARYLSPFVIHSTDDPVVPVRNSREPVKQLVDLGIPVRYREENGYGHHSKMIGDNFQRLFDWMDRDQLVKRPRRVTFATRTPKAGKAYWVWILKTDEFPQLATIDAALDTSNTLHISENNIRIFAIRSKGLPLGSESTIPVVIDKKFRCNMVTTDGWVLFTQRGDAPGWTVEPREESTLPKYKSPVVAPLAAALEHADNQTYLARAMGERIRRQTGADLCLVSEDMFHIARLPVTADAILDAYVWGDQRLVRFQTTVHHIQQVLHSASSTQRFLWSRFQLLGNLSRPYDTATIVVPIGLAENLKLPLETLPDTIPEYLLRSVRKGEAFP